MQTTPATEYAQDTTFAKGKEVLNAALRRSAYDRDFRSRLVADPRSAMSEVAGYPMYEEFNLAFIDGGGVPTVVLPEPVDAAAELSEADLENVAGGESATLSAISFAITAIADAIKTVGCDSHWLH
jgi:hypothetical protein